MTNSIPFPHPTLTPILDKPTAATIKQLKKEVYANARSVHSELRGGMNGHLGVVMNVAPYVIRAGQAFVEPIHPGVQAAHAANATQAQITAANRLHDKAKSDYSTYSKVYKTIKQQIMTAVKTVYYQGLEDDNFGYADVTVTLISPFQTSSRTSLITTDSSTLLISNSTDPNSPSSGTPTSQSKTSGIASASFAALLPLEATPSPMAPQSSSP
jgi:hypothetical protein